MMIKKNVVQAARTLCHFCSKPSVWITGDGIPLCSEHFAQDMLQKNAHVKLANAADEIQKEIT